jgi:hypothetical protein
MSEFIPARHYLPASRREDDSYGHVASYGSKGEIRGRSEKAHDEGPQIITRYGKPTAVIVSSEEYEKMRRWKQVEESTDE